MRKSYIVIGALFLAACSAPDELAKKQGELKEAKAQLQNVQTLIDSLEAQIAELDTTDIAAEKGTPVEAVTLEKTTFAHTTSVHGVVEASKNILANPEVSGRIVSINVREGQKVSKGQTIAVIDASIVRKNIEEVKKGLEFATTIYNKQKALNDKGVGTEVQFLEAKNRKESLEKSLSTLQSQLAKYVVTAPISGYVDDIIPKVGEMAGPQAAIARLVNLEKVFVEAEISEALLGKVNERDEVEVFFPNLKKTVEGKIVQTGQYIHPQNRTFKIKIDLEEQNSLFKPNLLSIVKLTDYKAQEVVVIPTDVVQDDLKGNFAFVVENDRAIKKYITLGMSNNTETEVLEGLEENQSVITKGHKGLVQGEIINIIK